eukprot:9384412-Pyramimonas_sp.AAC.1
MACQGVHHRAVPHSAVQESLSYTSFCPAGRPLPELPAPHHGTSPASNEAERRRHVTKRSVPLVPVPPPTAAERHLNVHGESRREGDVKPRMVARDTCGPARHDHHAHGEIGGRGHYVDDGPTPVRPHLDWISEHRAKARGAQKQVEDLAVQQGLGPPIGYAQARKV